MSRSQHPGLGEFATLSITGLTDPEEAAACASSGATTSARDRFCDRLERQLKLHLLLSGHLVMSDGFLFDNPALWSLLVKPSALREVLESHFDESPTLILQTTSGTIDERFRAWGDRAGRPVSPSALRGPWMHGCERKDDRAREDVSSLRKTFAKLVREPTTTFAGYLEEMGFRWANGLARPEQISDSLESVFNAAQQAKKSSERHAAYHQALCSWADAREREASEVVGDPWRAFVNELPRRAKWSRSILRDDHPAVWNAFRTTLIALRIESLAHLSHRDLGASETRFALSAVVDDAEKRMLEIVEPAPAVGEVLLLDQLSFEEVGRIRAHPSFIAVLDQMGKAAKEQAGPYDYSSIIRDRWAKTLLPLVPSRCKTQVASTSSEPPESPASAAGAILEMSTTGMSVSGAYKIGRFFHSVIHKFVKTDSPADVLVGSVSRAFEAAAFETVRR
jgi:hypothetical protein